jgi:hypothetical protein
MGCKMMAGLFALMLMIIGFMGIIGLITLAFKFVVWIIGTGIGVFISLCIGMTMTFFVIFGISIITKIVVSLFNLAKGKEVSKNESQ